MDMNIKWLLKGIDQVMKWNVIFKKNAKYYNQTMIGVKN